MSIFRSKAKINIIEATLKTQLRILILMLNSHLINKLKKETK